MQAVQQHRKEILPLASSPQPSGISFNSSRSEYRLPARSPRGFVGTVWAIAAMFAVPVIVTTKQKISALDAVRSSAGIIKKTWGENIIVNGGIAAVGILAVVLYFLLAAIIAWTAVAILGTGMGVVPCRWSRSVLSVYSLPYSCCQRSSAIVKAAVFYYATSGRTQKNSIQSYFVPVSQPKRLVVCLAPHDLSLITISQCTLC